MTNEFDDHAAFYNSLLIVEKANASLTSGTDRDAILKELAPVLAGYPNGARSGAQFGICLVHRHFELDNGEKMVSHGDITQPQSQPQSVYPSRWTAEGKPFEFTRDETRPLPDDLPPKFQAIVNKYDVKVLGLHYVEDATLMRGVGIEHLDPSTRSQIVQWGEQPSPNEVLVETDWAVRFMTPVTSRFFTAVASVAPPTLNTISIHLTGHCNNAGGAIGHQPTNFRMDAT